MVNLQKGQKISLEKEGNLDNVFMGLGWDVAKKSNGGFLKGLFGMGSENSIDLDASCILFDNDKNYIDTVYFGNLFFMDKVIEHTGDNLTGFGDGDDEVIKVCLSRLPDDVKYLVFTVNSFRGQTFDEIENAFCRLVGDDGKEIARYEISGGGSHTAMIMCKLYRHEGRWKMHAMGEHLNARTAMEMTEPVKRIL